MQIHLYATVKRKNSLRIPTGSGVTKNVVLKDNTTLVQPSFVLNYDNSNPTQYNYLYCADFLRYYYIRDWEFDGRLWIAHCESDPLASFREQILSSTFYVLRSGSTSNSKILDTKYPATTEHKIILSSQADLNFASPFDPHAGRFVLGSMTRGANADSPSGITYYVLDAPALKAIRENLYPDLTSSLAGLDDLATIPGIVLANPTQYIASLMWFPFTPSCTIYSNLDICLGFFRVWHGDGVGIASGLTHEKSFTLTPARPSTSRGDWQKLPPYCRYYIQVPYFGLIDIPGEIGAYRDIYATITISIVTGMATLRLRTTADNGELSPVFATRCAQIGQPFQLTGIAENWQGLAGGAGQALAGGANLALGNVGTGALQLLNGAIDTACAIMAKSADSHGTMGGTTETSYTARIVTEYFEPCEESNNMFGRPLCEARTLSGLSGFCQVANGDNAQTRATPAEKAEIKSYLEGGFFIE